MEGGVLTRLIKEAHERDEFFDIIVYGEKKGIGKSVYALLVLRELYDSWKEVFNYVFFSPLHLLLKFEMLFDEGEVIPVALLDDAGLYLSKLSWQSKEKVSFAEFYHVIREVSSCVIHTTPRPTDIIKGIRDHINLHAEVIPVGELDREVRIYVKRTTPILQERIRKEAYDEFSLSWIPEKVYAEYRQLKREFAKKKLIKARNKFMELYDEEMDWIAEKLGIDVNELEEVPTVKGNGRKRKRLPDEEPNIRCYHCEHEWRYTGDKLFQATCPECRRIVYFKKAHKLGYILGPLPIHASSK